MSVCCRRWGLRYHRLVLSDLLTADGRSVSDAAYSCPRYRGGLAQQVDCEKTNEKKDEFSESLGPFPFRYFNLFSTLSQRDRRKKEKSQRDSVGRYLPTGALSLAHHSLFFRHLQMDHFDVRYVSAIWTLLAVR